MRSFLKNCISFFASVGLILLLLNYWSNQHYKEQYKDHYLASLNEKAICVSSKTPKILLAGGSNVAFGMDSKVFMDSLNLPVCNIGLHGVLGLKFYLDQVEEMANPKDCVVFSIGYYVKLQANRKLLYVARKIYPDAKNWGYKMNFIERSKFLINDTKKALKSIIQNQPEAGKSIYKRSAFNEQGDMVGHLGLGHLPKLRGGDFDFGNENYQLEVNAMNEWAERLESKGVKVYYAFTAIPETEFAKSQLSLIKYERFIRKNLKFPILNDLNSVIYGERDFYDSVYHLSDSGRKTYSNQLVRALMHVEK